MLPCKSKLSGSVASVSAVFLLSCVLNIGCIASATAATASLEKNETKALAEQLTKISSLWKVDIVAKISPQNSLLKEVPMNDISSIGKSRFLDTIALENELGWGKLNDTFCFFALSELPKEPVDNPIDITRHRMTYAARFFAHLPQSQLEQLRGGERIPLEQLPVAALQALQTLVDPEGYSLEAPRQGFFAVSLGFAPNYAVVKPEEVAPLFRVFLLPNAQLENSSAQNIDLQTMFEQTQKTLPTLKNQVKLSRNGLWKVTELLAAIQDSDAIQFRLGEGAKDERIFLSKTQWSAQELLKAVLVVTNTRLSKDGDDYVLNVVADPAEDLQTEQWFSHLSQQSRENADQDKAAKNQSWAQLTLLQQQSIDASLELTPEKKEIIDQQVNETSLKFRLSSGQKLSLTYYKTGDVEVASVQSVEIPLFDPWISASFSKAGELLQ